MHRNSVLLVVPIVVLAISVVHGTTVLGMSNIAVIVYTLTAQIPRSTMSPRRVLVVVVLTKPCVALTIRIGVISAVVIALVVFRHKVPLALPLTLRASPRSSFIDNLIRSLSLKIAAHSHIFHYLKSLKQIINSLLIHNYGLGGTVTYHTNENAMGWLYSRLLVE